jgi:hypothetical protein
MAAATQYYIVGYQRPGVVNAEIPFTIKAVDATGALDSSYAGTAHVTSSDPTAELPKNLTFVAGIASARITFHEAGAQSFTAQDLATPTIHGTAPITLQTELGWGLDPYGLGPYGSAGAGVGINLVAAFATSTNDVEVELSGEPTHSSPGNTGDALNPNTWMVQRLDTTDFLHVVRVVPVTPTKYLVTCLEKFGPDTVTHVISSATLKDASGQLLIPPRSADFAGVTSVDDSSNDEIARSRGAFSVDLDNPQVPVPRRSVGGTLVVTAAGDYDTVFGPELVKKLLIRRWFTRKGAFFDQPGYGEGVAPKQIVRLPQLKRQLENSSLAEPEIITASVVPTLDPGLGILTIQAKVQTRTAGVVEFSHSVSIA